MNLSWVGRISIQNNPLKLLILSDAHGARWKVNQLIELVKPDIIVIPGDLPSWVDFPVLALSYLNGRRRTYVNNIYNLLYTER